MYYINIFLIYSIIGYLFEALITLITKGEFKSGIMYGPWTPIYGIGVIIILLLSNYLFKNLHLPKFYEIIIALILIVIILTILEWLGGISIEKLFHKTLWDYSNQKYHIGKYISLTASITWAVGTLLVIYIINPFLKDTIKTIPSLITIILLILFLIDFIYTIIKNIKV